jgi:hypothetical protein
MNTRLQKKLGYNEHLGITNKFQSKVGNLSLQINPVMSRVELLPTFKFTGKTVKNS